MKKNIVLIYLCILFISTTPILAETVNQKRKSRLLELMDTNGDSKISNEECLVYFETIAIQQAEKLFTKGDENSDGVLSEDEITTTFEAKD